MSIEWEKKTRTTTETWSELRSDNGYWPNVRICPKAMTKGAIVDECKHFTTHFDRLHYGSCGGYSNLEVCDVCHQEIPSWMKNLD